MGNPDERRFLHNLDAMLEGLQIIDFQWRYAYVNEAVCRHARRSRGELLGRTMMEAFPGIDDTPMFAALERCMRERTPCRMENEFVHADGSRSWFELSIEPAPEGVLVLSVDVTDRKKLEHGLRHAQKMEAVGRLAGGVAHDFNNLLTVIKSFGVFVLDTLDPQAQAHADMREVLVAADRAASLTRQLLAFSRKQAVSPRVIDLNALVLEMDRMLRRIVGEHIEVVTAPGDDLWRVRIDPDMCQQVIVNLVVNARDAMPEGGRLTLETANARFDTAYALRRGLSVPAGDYVMLAVSDSGIGMNESMQEHIFEPFFTTKPAGEGTGLGLSTCHGIVGQAGGYIWVYSEPGQGTTIKVYLPRVARPADVRASEAPPARAPTGTERVLVVEDDTQVRGLSVRSLRAYGYRVLEAANGVEALRLAEALGEPIALLVTDVVMPGMNGRVLAETLQRRQPGLRVLYTTGYTENVIVHHGVLDAGVEMLPKPYTPESLARRVRGLLD